MGEYESFVLVFPGQPLVLPGTWPFPLYLLMSQISRVCVPRRGILSFLGTFSQAAGLLLARTFWPRPCPGLILLFGSGGCHSG